MALKIYEQSAKDTWNTDVLKKKKKKNPKRSESVKKGKTRFWKSFKYIEFGNEGKKG